VISLLSIEMKDKIERGEASNILGFGQVFKVRGGYYVHVIPSPIERFRFRGGDNFGSRTRYHGRKRQSLIALT
jgi:hypothetical protein